MGTIIRSLSGREYNPELFFPSLAENWCCGKASLKLLILQSFLGGRGEPALRDWDLPRALYTVFAFACKFFFCILLHLLFSFLMNLSIRQMKQKQHNRNSEVFKFFSKGCTSLGTRHKTFLLFRNGKVINYFLPPCGHVSFSMSKSWRSKLTESQLAKDKRFKVLNCDGSAIVTDGSMVTMASKR